MSDESQRICIAIREFLSEHPDVTNPALVLHGILEANPELRHDKELDLDSIGLMVQYCEKPPE